MVAIKATSNRELEKKKVLDFTQELADKYKTDIKVKFFSHRIDITCDEEFQQVLAIEYAEKFGHLLK